MQDFYRGTRVFISGGAGVIGSALVGRLQELGAELFVGDLKPKPKDWPGTIRYRRGDLNEATSDELLDFEAEVFFHLAATFERSAESPEHWTANWHHNIKLGHHLCNIFKQSKHLKRLVNASSYLVYHPDLYLFEHAQEAAFPLREDARLQPRNLTGAAKYLHENELTFLEQFDQTPFSSISARIYRVYGRGSRDIISRWIRMAQEGQTLQVFAKEGLFDYIFADDVAEGLLRLGASNARGVVNLGTGKARRVEEVISVLGKHFPNMVHVEQDSDQLYEASEADTTRLESFLSWLPPHDLETAIPKLIAYEEAEPTQPSNMGSVLITSVSAKVPLVQAVGRALHRFGDGYAVYGGDLDPNCRAAFYCDAFLQLPPLSRMTADDWIKLCREREIRFIVPTRDGELATMAQLKGPLAEAGIAVMVGDYEPVTNCLDKLIFAQLLGKQGLPVIPTYDRLDDLEADRIVVKDRYGAAGRGMRIDVNRETAHVAAKDLETPIFQPFIEGTEYSIDAFADQPGRCKGIVVRRRILVVNGESQVTATCRRPELEELCRNTVATLKLSGHLVMQAFIDAQGQTHIIECNPRIGGASTLSLAAGLDSFYWFFLQASGEDLDAYPFHRCKGEKRLHRAPADTIITEPQP